MKPGNEGQFQSCSQEDGDAYEGIPHGTAILHPGDVIYIPRSWPHQVQAGILKALKQKQQQQAQHAGRTLPMHHVERAADTWLLKRGGRTVSCREEGCREARSHAATIHGTRLPEHLLSVPSTSLTGNSLRMLHLPCCSPINEMEPIIIRCISQKCVLACRMCPTSVSGSHAGGGS